MKNCHIPVIHTLLEAGCDPDVKDHVRYLFSYTICEMILSLHAHVSVIYYSFTTLRWGRLHSISPLRWGRWMWWRWFWKLGWIWRYRTGWQTLFDILHSLIRLVKERREIDNLWEVILVLFIFFHSKIKQLLEWRKGEIWWLLWTWSSKLWDISDGSTIFKW